MSGNAARLEVLLGGRGDATIAGDTDWLTPAAVTDTPETAASPWEPEHQLVGALMWVPTEVAQRITALVPATAIERPITRWSYEIIAALVAGGHKPDPVVVLATAGRQPCTIAADPTTPPSPTRHHQLSVYLARAYTETVSADNAASYAREVLEVAYRRVFAVCGQRMQVIAEAEADRAELTEQFAAVREDLLDWWRRAEVAAQPGWADQ